MRNDLGPNLFVHKERPLGNAHELHAKKGEISRNLYENFQSN